MKEGATVKQPVKGRKQAVIVFILPCLLFGLAWVMYFSGNLVPEGRTNKGALILPPGQFDDLALHKKDDVFSVDRLEGLWSIVVFGSNSCSDSTCQDVLYKTRQVHIGLGHEADRVKRIYVAEHQPVIDKSVEEQHPGVLWLEGRADSVEKTLSINQWPTNRYYIVDPLGNIMMRYEPEQEGGDLLRDMQKLLRVSNIG